MSDTITLNKATGSQSVVCSAPSGLSISTNVNTAPISFNCQSASGTFNNVLQLSANANPRVFMNITEARITDTGNTGYKTSIFNTGGSTIIQNNSTAGTGGITLDVASSAGNGAITLKTKDGTPSTTTGLILTGSALTSSTAGGSAGQYLCITIGTTLYKIALLNA
jgi:hypothetical protein